MAFKIIRNDITKVKADIIVNSANTKPVCAGYRTDAAIYEAAGYEEMLAARRKIGVIEVGHAEVTPAFGLPAKYVVHTVGPKWIDGKSGEPEALRSCFRESLSKAVSLRARSIAFPLISTGAFKFPKDLALEIATDVFKEFTSENRLDVFLVVYDKESFELTSDMSDFVSAYIDEHYVGKLTESRLEKYRSMNSPQDELWEWKGDEDLLDLESGEKARVLDLEMDEPLCNIPEDSRYIRPCTSISLAAPNVLKKDADKKKNVKVFSAVTGKLEKDLEKKIAELHIPSFGERLAYYIFEKKLEPVDVYSAVFMDRKHFSKLLSDKIKQPKRETVLALAIGLKLSVLETRDFLSHAGYSFTPDHNLTDVIVAAFVEQNVYDVFRINEILSENDLPQLG